MKIYPEVTFFLKFRCFNLNLNRRIVFQSTRDGLTNWEGSQADDGERFSQGNNNTSNGSKTLKSFDAYLKKKEYRKSLKKRGYEKI